VILVVFDEDLMPVGRAIAPGARVIGMGELGSFSGQPVYGLGYAGGADSAASLMLSQPWVLSGAVLLRPGRVKGPEVLPDLAGVRVLVVPGRDGSHSVAELLAKAGAAVDLAVQDADEFLVPADFALAKRWLGQFAQG